MHKFNKENARRLNVKRVLRGERRLAMDVDEQRVTYRLNEVYGPDGQDSSLDWDVGMIQFYSLRCA